MNNHAERSTHAPPGAPAGKAHRPEFQELWLSLARRKWNSLVVVPADGECSSAKVANSLAEVGKELADGPVTALTLTKLGYGSARALSYLQQYVDRTRQDGDPPGAADDASVVDVSDLYAELPDDAASPPRRPGTALALPASAQLVISIPPVVTEPLGLAVAQAADAVVLIFRLGKTRLSEARRTIGLLGRDRIAGCFIER